MPQDKKYVMKQFGPFTARRDYSKTKYNLPVSDLVATQKESFDWFLNYGIDEALNSVYPITSTNGKITIEYLPKTLRLEKPKSEYDFVKQAKQKGTTYGLKIYATLRKRDEETGEVNDSEVLFGEIPLMTTGGTFVINGSEKVITAQLLRSPGAYFDESATRGVKSVGTYIFSKLEMIPKLGIWLEVYHITQNLDQFIKSSSDDMEVTEDRLTKVSEHAADKTKKIDFVRVSIDKNKYFPLSTFLRSMGMSKDSIISLFGDTPLVNETIRRDTKMTEEEALEYIHGILKKGDRITEESKRNLYANLLFNKRRYDLSKTGRYTLNRKLNLIERLENTILAEDLTNASGKVLFAKNTRIDFELAKKIQAAFKNGTLPLTDIPEIDASVYGTQIENVPSLANRTKVASVYVWASKEMMDAKDDPIRVLANDPNADEDILLVSDIIAAFSYYFNLAGTDGFGEVNKLGSPDDSDSLSNKRIYTIGELLKNQLQIGLIKMERNAKERMSAKEVDKITAKNITNNKAVYNQFKSFFNSSSLSQFMDQMNPLAEISNKRRVTSLGPGGLNRDTAIFDVRDVHSTHYGRLCPIETPEGPNIGLILNFANYSRVNEFGFVETPYYKVEKGVVIPKPVYLTAADERGYTFAQSTIALDDNDKIKAKEVIVRKDGEYVLVPAKDVNYVDVSSKQMTSLASSAIPFLENDDANRALMGANMQRQAVPLIRSEAPLVGTGIEADIARYSASNLKVVEDGVVAYVDSEIIKVRNEAGKLRTYQLRTFERSNQGSIISQRPLVQMNQEVKVGDILTDGPSFDKGEMALGKNVVVAFSTWNGYNFEDAVILSERLVKDDIYTSLHIEEQTIEFRTSKIGDDELTTDIPNVSNYSKRNLTSEGIIRIGAEVEAGDVLVGRVSPKGEDNPTPEEKLIAAIFTQKTKNVKDTSLKVKHGHSGIVIDVQVLSRETSDVLPDDIMKIVKVLIAQKRKIKVGDKMAGRHGNKGVISRVLPIEDMPHLADGTPVDMLLNPQGVPSRMNIGQVLEVHLGMAAQKLGVKFATPVFDGIKYSDINEALKEAKLPENGKFDLYDPISGKKFDNKVTVGVMYMLKLAHMVDDKMHARSVGPYSLITQQPLGGKSQNGGQRFGEMEAWAIESYGATNVLQELLTYKSDNIEGRNKVYNALASGAPLPTPGTPESFNVLAYELRGLGIKLSVETKDEGEAVADKAPASEGEEF